MRSLALVLSKMGHHWRTLNRRVASSYLVLRSSHSTALLRISYKVTEGGGSRENS